MTKTVLGTGCFGFIGSCLVEHLIKNTDWNIVIIDKLTYATKGYDRLRDIGLLGNSRIKYFTHDLVNDFSEGMKKEIGEIDYIYHLAAESHVDSSINMPEFFIYNNVMSTVKILEYARTLKNLELFLYFSTDEVYGPAGEDILFKEDDRHNPCNPYSASKSASESVCTAYANTYDIKLMTVNTMNVYGEKQNTLYFW